MESPILKTNNPADRVALRGVRVHAILTGMSQMTTLDQSFVNLEPRPIEAVYTFPLPDGAAVCGFEVFTGDRVLTGAVDETEAAVERYEAALAAGDAAFTAEAERPDVFTVRVGNLDPGRSAVVRLTFVAPLDVVDDAIRLVFPTTVAPRYRTDAGTDSLDAAIDRDALNPPHVFTVPYGLTFTADVGPGRDIKLIESPSHSVQVTGDNAVGYNVSLPGVTPMDRELVLSIHLAKHAGPTVQCERGKNNETFLAVIFVPEFDPVTPGVIPSETIFVLDCSGSMAGSSIHQATTALELSLRTLNEGDTFNICKFGTDFQLMNPEPVAYSQATLDRAIAYIAGGNNLGGTELLAPLQAVLSTPAAGRPRNVILLTDGQVTNEPAVLALARRHRSSNRIFAFGIGPACSTFLVNGLARATGGAAEFISAGERIEHKVLRTFARLASPLATDVGIDWGGADVQTLAELPPVFDGDVLTVFGRVDGPPPAKVTLKCRTSAGEQEWTVAVAPSFVDGRTIATMWARRSIQSFEEVNNITRTARPATGPARDLLIRLSREFGLLSSLTTFIAVEHRSVEDRNDGRPATRRVPVMLAAGWGGIAAPAGAMSAKRRVAGSVLHDSVGLAPAMRARSFSDKGKVPVPAAAAPQSARVDDLNAVLRLQSAIGAFEWTDDLKVIAVIRVPGWVDRFKKIDADVKDQPHAVVDTVKAILLLRHGFADDKALWTRAGEKAVRWLTGRVHFPVAEVETMLGRF